MTFFYSKKLRGDKKKIFHADLSFKFDVIKHVNMSNKLKTEVDYEIIFQQIKFLIQTLIKTITQAQIADNLLYKMSNLNRFQ